MWSIENKMEEIELKVTRNGEEEKGAENNLKEKKKKVRKLGGLKTMPFILSNEICDRFATTGSHANMITYLTQELNLPLVKASNILSNFNGTASLTPLIGALMADSFAGRFWTIIVGSIIYELGLVSITLSAILPHLRPPPCPTQQNCQEASNMQIWILYLSLILTCLGTGGIRPCVVTFAADQMDMTKAKKEARGWNFFNGYYFCIGMAILVALTLVVYVQDNVGWGWGLGIPAIAMAFAIVVFTVGSPLYKKLKPGGSPLVRLAQVIVAAIKKRNAIAPQDPNLLYDNTELDADISSVGKLLHTDHLTWFDRAAIVSDEDKVDPNHPNLWRIATVHRVEELKSIIRMLPISASAILLVAANSHLNSFNVQQARSMDRHLSHSFEIPPATMAIFSILTVLIGLVLYERFFVPFARRFTGHPDGITYLQRMGIGFAFNILSSTVGAFVEIKRKQVASNHNLLDKPSAIIPISVFWLVPQLFLHGLAELFMFVGHLEFLYDQAPESMRTTAAALYWIAISFGNYTGTLVVSLVHNYSGNQRNWLPDRNLNRGRLDCYYFLVSGIQLLNLIYYVICAYFYKYKQLEEVQKQSSEGDEDVAIDKIPSKPLNAALGNGGSV